jgi:hypothetical protein
MDVEQVMNVERDVVTYLFTEWDDSSKKTKMAFVGELRRKSLQVPGLNRLGASQVSLACHCTRLFP